MVRPERFELPTPKFVAWCSIQLSYGRSGGIVQNRLGFRQLRWNMKLAESEGLPVKGPSPQSCKPLMPLDYLA